MFFASATILSAEFGVNKIALCTDELTEKEWAEEKEDGLDRIWYERPICREIMKVAAKDCLPISFSCNDVQYQLISYVCRPEERYYNEYRVNHVVRKERVAAYTEINIYSERCRCGVCYAQYGFDSIENICGIVQTRDDPRHRVEIDLQHCTRCRKYFIDQQSLAKYEHRYGRLCISKHHITDNEEYGGFRLQDTYKADTVLSRNGYSARLPASQRKAIIVSLLESGESSKAEIKEILSCFINRRSERCPRASIAWSDDLEFVNDYDIENEDRVQFQ